MVPLWWAHSARSQPQRLALLGTFHPSAPNQRGTTNMARIRTIKPEFPHSESMGRVSRDARLCFILMWTLADDEGRLRGNSRMLASLLYPYDDDAPALIEGWLSELDGEGCITRYQVEGTAYVEICNWSSHQKIDRPSKSKFPCPDEGSRMLANPREDSALDQGRDQGRDQGEEGSGSAPRKRVAVIPKPESVDDQTWTDFLALRKAKRAPLTSTALQAIETEASKAKMSLQAALSTCCARGWQGFKAEWVARDAAASAKPQGESFRERDARLAREKFAEWTGRAPDQPRPAVIDVTPTGTSPELSYEPPHSLD